eukprot:132816_1
MGSQVTCEPSLVNGVERKYLRQCSKQHQRIKRGILKQRDKQKLTNNRQNKKPNHDKFIKPRLNIHCVSAPHHQHVPTPTMEEIEHAMNNMHIFARHGHIDLGYKLPTMGQSISEIIFKNPFATQSNSDLLQNINTVNNTNVVNNINININTDNHNDNDNMYQMPTPDGHQHTRLPSTTLISPEGATNDESNCTTSPNKTDNTSFESTNSNQENNNKNYLITINTANNQHLSGHT